MKPLTIEQLKALEVGDWVWIINSFYPNGTYVKVDDQFSEDEFYYGRFRYNSSNLYSTYGENWKVYKNKEQAEAKGEIVELPCKIETLHVGDTVYYIQEYFNDATLKHERQVKRTIIDYIAKDYIEVNNGVWLSADKFWLIPQEAERRLAEIKGE